MSNESLECESGSSLTNTEVLFYHPVKWDLLLGNISKTSNDSNRMDFIHDLYVLMLDSKHNSNGKDESTVINCWKNLLDVLFEMPLISYDVGMIDILCNMSSVNIYSTDLQIYFRNAILFTCSLIQGIFDCVSPRLAVVKLVMSYRCLVMWTVNYCDIFKDKKCLMQCLSAVKLFASEGTDQSARKDNDCDEFHAIANNWSQQLLKQLCYHPYHSGQDDPCRLSEQDILKYWQYRYPDDRPMLQYLLVTYNHLLCLIDPPPGVYDDVRAAYSDVTATDVGLGDADVTPTLYKVVRDPCSGPIVHWMKYELEELSKISVKREQASRPVGITKSKTSDDNQVEWNLDWSQVISGHCNISSDDSCTINKLLENIKENGHFQSYIKECRFSEQNTVSYPIPDKHSPEDLKIPACCRYPNSSRLFLSHSGLLSSEMFDEKHEIRRKEDGSSLPVVLLQNNALLQAKLKKLDEIPTRDCFTAAVLYLKSGQNSFLEALNNERVLQSDPRFRIFVSNLGSKIVDVFKFDGWRGLKTNNLDAKNSYTLPYYSNALDEMVFLIPNLLFRRMRTNSTKNSTKQEGFCQEDSLENTRWDIVNSDLPRVVIVWSESSENASRIPLEDLPDCLQCDDHSNFIVIFLISLLNQSVLTDVRWTGNCSFIEQYDLHEHLTRFRGRVVHESVLPTIVRELCLFIRSACVSWRCDLMPQSLREQVIGEISEECQSEDYENGYFDCFFKRH